MPNVTGMPSPSCQEIYWACQKIGPESRVGLSHKSTSFNLHPDSIPQMKKKCPEVPSLLKYYVPPYRSFWNFFPKTKLPETPKICMDIFVLKL
jgi:hypothetical protein